MSNMLVKQELADNNCHVMVDLETMGTKHYAPILTIGAVLFNPHQQTDADVLLERAFIRQVNLADTLKYSNGVEPDTLQWWLGQEDEAIKALLSDEAVGIKTAITDLRHYCFTRGRYISQRKGFPESLHALPQASCFWAKDPDFDGKLLEDACERLGEPNLFKFYQYRSVRTVQSLAWPDDSDRPVFDLGVKHDAKVDAVSQALTVQAAFLALNRANTGAVLARILR